jgi:hypothetical protein
MTTFHTQPDATRRVEHRRTNEHHIEHTHEVAVSNVGRFTARADGPAAIRLAADEVVREEWAAHSDPSTVKDYNNHQPTVHQGYAIHTYLHREDGPALVERMEGKTVETWFRNNQEYHPTAHERMKWEAKKIAHGGTPFHADTLQALAGEDPSMGSHSETWTEARKTGDGKQEYRTHRIGAPAAIDRDRETGALIREHWIADNAFKNPNGPTERRFDPKTGVCTAESGWSIPGRPSEIRRDPKTGKVVEETWRNREDGPRNIWLNPKTGRVEESWPNKRSWYLDGKPTIKAAAAWEALKAQQGGPFTPGLDEVPRAQRPASVKEAAAAAAAKTESKRKTQHQDER